MDINIRKGASFHNGISLTTDHYEVCASRENGEIIVSETKIDQSKAPSYSQAKAKIPVIGPLFETFVFFFVKNTTIGITFVVTQIILASKISWSQVLTIYHSFESKINQLPFVVQLIASIILLSFVILRFMNSIENLGRSIRKLPQLNVTEEKSSFDLDSSSRYHSVEHKLVNCHEKGTPVSLESLREISSFNPKCGSLIVLVYITVVFLSCALIRIRWIPTALFLSSIATLEIREWIIHHPVRSIMKLAELAQRLACWTPSDEHLEVGIALWQRLVELEREYASKNQGA